MSEVIVSPPAWSRVQWGLPQIGLETLELFDGGHGFFAISTPSGRFPVDAWIVVVV